MKLIIGWMALIGFSFSVWIFIAPVGDKVCLISGHYCVQVVSK